MCRALRSMWTTKKNEFTRSLQWARPTGQPVITVLSDLCQAGRRDSCPGPWESEVHQPGSVGASWEAEGRY